MDILSLPSPLWSDVIIPLLDETDMCKLEACNVFFRTLLHPDKETRRDRWILTNVMNISDKDVKVILEDLKETYETNKPVLLKKGKGEGEWKGG